MRPTDMATRETYWHGYQWDLLTLTQLPVRPTDMASNETYWHGYSWDLLTLTWLPMRPTDMATHETYWYWHGYPSWNTCKLMCYSCMFLRVRVGTDAPRAVSGRAEDVPGYRLRNLRPPHTHDSRSVCPRHYWDAECSQQVPACLPT